MLISKAFYRQRGKIRFGAKGGSTGADVYERAQEVKTTLSNLDPRSPILLAGRPGIDWVAGLLAIWEAGHVAVPVPERGSAVSKQLMARIAGSRWEFDASENHLSGFGTYAGHSRDVHSKDWPEGSKANFPHSEDDLSALILFTSGTTGVPKAVVLSHQNLFEGARNIIEHFDLRQKDHGLGLLPLTHINGIVTTLLSPVMSGGCVTFYSDVFLPDRFQEMVKTVSPTWVSGVPFHYERLVEKGPEWLSGTEIRFFRSASAPLKRSTLSTFVEKTGKPLVETMGMTECAGQIFANPIESGAQRLGSVGRPVNFDVEMRPVQNSGSGPGDDSELCVRGPSVALGWVDESGEFHRISPNEFFPTGDLGFIDEDGFVFITGRLKEILNVGGIKIPLRLLEAVLLEIPGIRDAAVVPEDGNRLTAFIAIEAEYAARNAILDRAEEKPDRRADELQNQQVASVRRLGHAINSALRADAPAPVKASKIILLRELPRTSTGKLIRPQLERCEPIRVIRLDQNAESVLSLVAARLKADPDLLEGDLSLGKRPEWDSLLQVEIITALEDKLGRRLTEGEVNESESIDGIKRILNDREQRSAAINVRSKAVDAYLDEMQRVGFARSSHTLLIVTRQALLAAGDMDVDSFLSAAMERSNDCVLLMNSFSWSFCKTGHYHFEQTPCETGIVAEQFRKRPSVFRTPHPLYSYAVFGPGREFMDWDFVADGWDRQSVLGYLCESADLNVVIDGLELLKGNPSVHYVERLMRVPYRYQKEFSGKACFSDQGFLDCAVHMYVRRSSRPNYRNDWSSLINVMQAQRAFSRSKQYPSLYGYRNLELVESAKAVLEADRYALATVVEG